MRLQNSEQMNALCLNKQNRRKGKLGGCYRWFCLLMILVLWACESDDDGSLRADAIGISEVIAPEALRVGQSAAFSVIYDRPSSCHSFLRFDRFVDNQSLTVRLVAGVFGNNCGAVNEEPRVIDFTITPQSAGPIMLSFMKNPDDNPADLITFEFEVMPE